MTKYIILIFIVLSSNANAADIITWTENGVVHMSNSSCHRPGETATDIKVIKSDQFKKAESKHYVKQHDYKVKSAASRVPKRVRTQILREAIRVHPNNYKFQQIFYDKQIKAYLAMKNLNMED